MCCWSCRSGRQTLQTLTCKRCKLIRWSSFRDQHLRVTVARIVRRWRRIDVVAALHQQVRNQCVAIVGRRIIVEILHVMADVLHASAAPRYLFRMCLPEAGNDGAHVLDLTLTADFVGRRLIVLIAARTHRIRAIFACAKRRLHGWRRFWYRCHNVIV